MTDRPLKILHNLTPKQPKLLLLCLKLPELRTTNQKRLTIGVCEILRRKIQTEFVVDI